MDHSCTAISKERPWKQEAAAPPPVRIPADDIVMHHSYVTMDGSQPSPCPPPGIVHGVTASLPPPQSEYLRMT